jgi:hypothetical protein
MVNFSNHTQNLIKLENIQILLMPKFKLHAKKNWKLRKMNIRRRRMQKLLKRKLKRRICIPKRIRFQLKKRRMKMIPTLVSQWLKDKSQNKE